MALIDNLVSYWKLDETSGTRADSHGSNNLTDNNTVTQATGKIGNCADFEFSNSEYLSIADASQGGLDITGDMSVSFWVKVESLPGSANYKILSKWGASNGSYMVGYRDASGTPKIRLDLYDNGDGSTNVPVDWTYTLTVGTWFHVVITSDVGVSDTISELFINGSSQGTGTHTGVNSIFSGTGPFNLGAYGGIDGYYDGLLDEVGIWSKVLSGTEVTELYNSGSGLAYPFSTSSSIKTINGLLMMGAG